MTNTQNIIDNYLIGNKQPKLQIGCGNNAVDGWLNTDINPINQSIAFLDARKEFPFKDNTFSYIYSEHIFEHLKFSESCNMISECFRTLKPNGIIRLAIPHVDFLFKLYQNPDLPIHKEYIKWAIESFCKDITTVLSNDDHLEVYVINNFYRDWGHKVLHNFDSLKKLLEKFNFSAIQKKEVGKSDFEDLSDMEMHGEFIPLKFNILETLVVEAKKHEIM